MTTPARPVAVLGAGNWGTTLAHLMGETGHEVRLWSRSAETCRSINEAHRNEPAVPSLLLSPRVNASTRLDWCVEGAAGVVIVIPAQSFREVSRQLGETLTPAQMVLHASKGLEKGTHLRMSEVLQQETCAKQIGVLAGPNIAAEIAAGKPAGTVITSPFPAVVEWGRRLLSSPRMMVFGGSDVLGVELCGALKNVVAIAAGIASEMDVGENAKAFLVTRGLAEITRLAASMGAEPATLMGLAGAGDLMVTCASKHSRNHRVGQALARGVDLDRALAQLGMVAEGVPTSIAARDLARGQGIACPLMDRVHRVLFGGLSPQDALEELMRLPGGRDSLW